MTRNLIRIETVGLGPAPGSRALGLSRLPRAWSKKAISFGWFAFPVVAVAVSAWLLTAYQASPWLWLALVWTAALSAGGYCLRQTWQRAICINIAAVIFAFGIVELWFKITADEIPQQTYTGDYIGEYFVHHPVLGYGPRPGFAAASGLWVNGRRIYEVSYGIDGSGLRMTPASPTAESSVLFFGGSFTFGEGVSDMQSMPYRVGQLTGSGMQIHNFGFHGYGPHQMLAALEFGLVETILEKPVRTVVYQAIADHVQRVAGRAFWDRSGPRYELTASRQARYAGHFDDGQGAFDKWLYRKLNQSAIYQRLFGVYRRISAADIDLFGAVVSRSRDLLLAQAPDADFHVLLWGYPNDRLYELINAALRERGITVHAVSDILPNIESNPGQYQLDADDSHPNALAHEEIARYVVKKILAGSVGN